MSPHALQAVGETMRTCFSHWSNSQECPRLGVLHQGKELSISRLAGTQPESDCTIFQVCF